MKRPSNKRTQALKNILEVGASNHIVDIKEDLIENSPNVCTLDSNIKSVNLGTKLGCKEMVKEASVPTNPPKSIEIFHKLIDKELLKAAKHLEIDELDLKAWADVQIGVPAKTILTLLRMMQSLHLDPLNDEIGFTQFEDSNWQVFITIEGCSKLLNQHPQFSGLIFSQANTLIEGVPEWMECSIYRKDRILPITVREHYLEVKGENVIWQKMPRRMLRHRALQQCVRLAI